MVLGTLNMFKLNLNPKFIKNKLFNHHFDMKLRLKI